MAHQSTLQRRAVAVLAALLLVVLVAGCGGSDDEAPEQSPAQVMEQAKKHFDEAASVHISLSTESTPSSGNGVLAATGTVTRDPAFEGDVTYVDGEVIEKLDKSAYGMPIVKVQTRMTTQTGDTILKGTAEVSLPV